jgi:hypothetical protein
MNRGRNGERQPTPAQIRHERLQQQAFRRSAIAIVGLVVVVALLAIWLNRPEAEGDSRRTEIALPEIRAARQQELPVVRFVDVTEEAGIDFVHENGAYGDKLLPETMGSGCALFDYDVDGDVDILLVNSDFWAWDERPRPETRPTLALYRNEGNWTFVDVTSETGLDFSCYGMGVAVGDMDNDGDNDLFLTTVGPNYLLRNDGGKFTDVTAEAGVQGENDQWSSSCAWFDYDKDGLLDLFVANYIRWSKKIDLAQKFTLDGTNRAYGPPIAFEGAFPYLYHNEGDGLFRDVSESMGIRMKNPATGVPMAKSLGVSPVDLDRDGWMDVVVANDTVQNFVFHNQGGQRFDEIGALAGVAFDSSGQARGAMGIDIAQFRNDQTVGVAVGNFANEMTALYVSLDDPLQFFDAGIATGLGPPTRLKLTFGVFFFDYDLDGRQDLLAANGHLEQDVNKVQESQHYEQPPQLFWNSGGEHGSEFVEVPPENAGDGLARPMVGRGSAFADLDGDGDEDVLLTANHGAPRLLRNDQQTGHSWIRFQLVGVKCNQNAIGAWIEVYAGDDVLTRQVMPTRGYLSQSDMAVTVGLGTRQAVDRVVIHWPDLTEQVISEPAINQIHVVRQMAAETN